MKKINFIIINSLFFMAIGIVGMEKGLSIDQSNQGRKRKLEIKPRDKINSFVDSKKFKIDEEFEKEIENEKSYKLANWHLFPDEIKMYILIFVLNADDMKGAFSHKNFKALFKLFKQFVFLRSASKDIRNIVLDPKFFNLEALARYLVDQRLMAKKQRFELLVAKMASRWWPALCSKLIEEGIFICMVEIPLVNAIYLHKIDRVRELIQAKRGKLSLPHDNELTLAAATGDVEMLNLFLKSNISDVHNVVEGKTALISATFYGCKKAVEFLLEKGSAIEHGNKKGKTALIIASRKGYEDVVGLLLDNGANINAKDNKGKTPLIAACQFDHKKVVKLLLKRGANANGGILADDIPLIHASVLGHVGVIATLLDSGAAIDTKNDKGKTPLMHACQLGQKKGIEFLLKRGANVNESNLVGDTPLMHAVASGHEWVIEILLDSGANIDTKNDKGKTALMHACQLGQKKAVGLLLKRGANVNECCSEGNTPLMCAAAFGHVGIIEILLDNGADVLATNNKSNFALFSSVHL